MMPGSGNRFCTPYHAQCSHLPDGSPRARIHRGDLKTRPERVLRVVTVVGPRRGSSKAMDPSIVIAMS